MKLQSPMVRRSLFILTLILAVPAFRAAAQSKPDSASAAQTAAVPARITQAIDETQLVRLPGNVHPLARPEFDQGVVPDATPMNRMLLLLQRSPEQQAALSEFMDEQLSKDSPNFHNWLTPQQFGKLYGPADADIQTVTDWLTRQGFQQIKIGAGRTVIEFSGNVAQVRNAFHTEIHQFNVNGEARQANVSDPQIPAALTPVVAGVVSLHNFPRKSMRHVEGPVSVLRETGVSTPLFTTSSGFFLLGPADFAKIYNVTPSGLDGTGATIAIVAVSNINIQDVRDFRILFGLPPNDPTIVLNGPDPGLNDAEGEADLDVQWAGAVAPKAHVDLVVSEDTLTSSGVDLSALYVTDNNTDAVMSVSFGACEAGLGAAENAFFNAVWEQAAAQGITVTVSSGDAGSAGCDNFNTAKVATRGLAVNGLASTPFNVAVGGTDFDDVGTQASFWSSTNGTGKESALGYIHEVPWNNSCAAAATSSNLNTVCATANNILAASGGPSAVNAKPAWQNGVTFADGHRDTPDISLFSSVGSQSKSAYVTCQASGIPPGNPPSCAASGPFTFFRTGGTSASAPAFAAIIALIDQKMGGRQGNANFVLYKLAATASNSCDSTATPLTGSATCTFYDVTKGNNAVPCAGGSLNCSSGTTGTNGVLVDPANLTTPAWTTKTGYDYATGLGTVDVANLATAWPTAVGLFKATTTSLKINGGTGPINITHGITVTAVVTVAANPGPGTPAGDASLLAPSITVNGGIGAGTLSSGTATINNVILPGGSYNVIAHYAGDGTFAPSDATPGVPVVVAKENSRLQYGIVTFDASGRIASTNATSFTYGSPYILRIDILNSTASACQVLVAPITTAGCAFDATGTVTITDNGAALDTGTFKINSAGSAEDQPIQLTGGSHALVANYSGDISYSPSGPLNRALMVLAAGTTTAVAANPTNVQIAQNVTLTATVISPASNGAGPTGTVVFSANGTPISGTVNIVTAPANFKVNPPTPPTLTATLVTTFSTMGTKTISAAFTTGDSNYSSSSSSGSGNATVTVTTNLTFTVSGTAATVTAGSSGPSTITVTPQNGFTGAVAITCGSLPGVSCSALSVNVTNANPATGQLTINVTGPSSSTTAMELPATQNLWAANVPPKHNARGGWWTLSAGTGLAAILLLLLPARKRYRAALGLGLVSMVSFAIGCGGGGGGGPVATNTTMTVSSTKVPSTGPNATITVSATVTSSGATPAGSVQFFDGTTALGSPVPLSGGSTGQITLTPASAPPLFQLVGTHSVSAHYLGNVSTLASQSGALNINITGTTQLPVTGTSGTTTASGNLSLTIQ